jgi:hypothetical protein
MEQKTIVKITVVTSKNGINNSITKHIPLGETLLFPADKEIVSIKFQEIKIIQS